MKRKNVAYLATLLLITSALMFSGSVNLEKDTSISTSGSTIIIQKFSDTNFNGIVEPDEERLPGWMFIITGPNGTTTTYVTNDRGEIIIEVPEGKYIIVEQLRPGWTSTTPTTVVVNVQEGRTTVVEFLNAALGIPTPTSIPTPIPTPIPSLTPTPTPVPTPMPTPTPTPTPMPPTRPPATPMPPTAPTLTPTPTLTPIPTPTPTPVPTPTPTPTPTPVPTPMPGGGGGGGGGGAAPPTPGPEPEPTPTPQATLTPTPTAPPTPGPEPEPTPTTAPQATPTPTPSFQELIDEELKKLSSGWILFNPREKMKVGIEERVEVRLTKDITENLTEGLKGPGAPQIEPIEVGTFMMVKLTGDSFDINALSSEEQVVKPVGFTEWSWDVTPLKSGRQVLHLTVTVRILIPGQDEQKIDWCVMDKRISVEVNPPYTFKRFIESHWQWIVGTVIAIVTLIATNGIRKKKRREKR